MVAYPNWIDEHARSVYQAWIGMVPSQWGALNFLELLTHLDGTFIKKMHQAVRTLKKERSVEEVAKSISSPSVLRCAFWYLTQEYATAEHKDKATFREVAEYLVEILRFRVPVDTFALTQNLGIRQEEIERMLKETPWQEGNPASARELGKLYNSAAAVAFALYRDFFPQVSHEVYGPYDANSRFGEGCILLVKDFPDLKHTELWPQTHSFSIGTLKIFQILQGVSFSCDWIGMHSRYEGDLINGLRASAVMANGQFVSSPEEIKKVRGALEHAAVEHSSVYEKMSIDEWIIKTLEWECFQFINFFKLAGMDWKPTKEMLENTKGKPVPLGVSVDSFPPFEEYGTNPEYEIYWLKDLYQ